MKYFVLIFALFFGSCATEKAPFDLDSEWKSWYGEWEEKDLRDISALKDTTGCEGCQTVVATPKTYKAWAYDIEAFVMPGDTLHWAKMEVVGKYDLRLLIVKKIAPADTLVVFDPNGMFEDFNYVPNFPDDFDLSVFSVGDTIIHGSEVRESGRLKNGQLFIFPQL